MMFEIKENEEVCANCQYYRQHYVMGKSFVDGFTAVNHGHCTYPRVKDRRPGETCERFNARFYLEE